MIFRKLGVSVKAWGYSPEAKIVFEQVVKVAAIGRGGSVRWYFTKGSSGHVTGAVVAHPRIASTRAQVADITSLCYEHAVDRAARAILEIIENWGFAVISFGVWEKDG